MRNFQHALVELARNPAAEGGLAMARAPVTCGELVQGTLEGRDFLITSPIDLYSQATVELQPDATVGVAEPPLVDFSKAVRAMRHVLERFASEGQGARLRIESQVPRGKGMASSSSDITAAMHACAEALGVCLPPHLMSRIAASIEPSDGVFFPGSVIYDHLRGEVLEFLGAPPPLSFVIVDTGGVVETLSFDRQRARENSRRNEARLTQAVDLVRKGFRQGSAALVAAGATLSARCHQEVLPKPELEELLRATRELGVLGINCGHSGTVLGLMFDPERHPAEPIRARAAELMGAERIIGVHRLVSGGSRLVRCNRQQVTDEQRPFLDTFGEPVERVRTAEGGSALGFEHGPGRRFFVLPDGSPREQHPDAREGLWEPEAPVALPMEGQTWELRVQRLSAGPEAVSYRPVVPVGGLRAVPRLLPPDVFEQSFTPDGEHHVRRVKVVTVGGGQVVLEPLEARGPSSRRTLALPLFLSTFGYAGGERQRAQAPVEMGDSGRPTS